MEEGMQREKRGQPRGFTLVELMMVIALVVVLAGLVLGVMSGVQRRAELARTEGELAVLAAALEQYRAVHGDYPWVAQHAVEGAAAEANGQRLWAALHGQRSPMGDRVLRGGELVPRPDPLATVPAAQRRTFVSGSELAVGRNGEVVDPSAATTGAPVSFYDPWGRPYVYLYRAEGAPAVWTSPGFVLFSLGPDGRAGTVSGQPPVRPEGRRSEGTATDGAEDNVYHGQS